MEERTGCEKNTSDNVELILSDSGAARLDLQKLRGAKNSSEDGGERVEGES